MVKSVVNGTLTWLMGDHLGSTSVTAQADGAFQSEMRYTAFGETRSNSGPTPTDYQYTGQRHEAEFGLYFYKARWYDPASAHFTQADSIIPGTGNPLALDRFAYVYYNPLKYTDPSGHIGSSRTDPHYITGRVHSFELTGDWSSEDLRGFTIALLLVTDKYVLTDSKGAGVEEIHRTASGGAKNRVSEGYIKYGGSLVEEYDKKYGKEGSYSKWRFD
jgi:RHS repeat-associated protein